VEQALTFLIKLNNQEKLRGFRGTLKWSDDLDRMRTD
jgi:hypothetical protein